MINEYERASVFELLIEELRQRECYLVLEGQYRMRDFVLIGLAINLPAAAQTNRAIRLHPVPRFTIAADALTVRRAVEAQRPFTVAGPSSTLLGEQSGKVEAWLYPVKILSQLAITAELANYGAPIDVNAQAVEIEMTPVRTTISYSHAAFTI